MPQTLYAKLWQDHVVDQEAVSIALLSSDRHLVDEVTSAQAFAGLRLAGRKPWRVSLIVATADHNAPTKHWDRGIENPVTPCNMAIEAGACLARHRAACRLVDPGNQSRQGHHRFVRRSR